MKKKLLCIWVPFVLIITVVGFVFYGDNKEYQENIEDDCKYLSAEECYDENWNIREIINLEFVWKQLIPFP